MNRPKQAQHLRAAAMLDSHHIKLLLTFRQVKLGVRAYELVIIVNLFPHGWDYAWLAIDGAGHVGIFTNAGEGPIPSAVLADREAADRAERLLKSLAERGRGLMLISLPRPDDFIAFARRGLFAYDWQDVHRTADRLHRYELLARPEAPVLVEELEAAVGALARLVRFESLRFAESSCVCVPDHVECYSA